MIESTCKKEECPFWKLYKDKCPHYTKSIFQTFEKEIKEIEDCAPLRSMLLCQDIHNQLVDMRKDYNQVRNTNVALLRYVIDKNAPEIQITDADIIDAKLLENK